jgi:spermidine synthase
MALAGWTAFAVGLFWQHSTRYAPFADAPRVWLANAVIYALAPAALWLIFVLAWRRRDAWWPPLARGLDAHTAWLDAEPAARLGPWILLAAGAGLFAELAIIRVHASFFQLFAYYKNVSLLSCFLGLGIGYALGKRGRVATPLVLPALALQIGLLHVLRRLEVGDFLQDPVSERAALGIVPVQGGEQALTVYGFLIAVFVTNALCFVPLGHVTSRLMLRLDRLVAYGWNLAGSVLGIAVFSLISFAWTPPSVWLLLLAGALAPLLRPRPVQLLASAACVAALMMLLGLSVHPAAMDLYSPYQILTLFYAPSGEPYTMTANNAYFQRLLDLSDEAVADHEGRLRWAAYYAIPYRLKPRPERVLVVGSGTGNDVAAALRHGAGRIDAVEIDPAIVAIGRATHPEAPYASPRVRVVVDDARSFLRHTDARYDVIVYGLLDSHTLLSGASNVRLDSYVYTVEALREARERLADGGLLSLSFTLVSKPLGRKLYLMLEQAFDGVPPRVARSYYDDGVTFLITEGGGGALAGPFPKGMMEVTDRLADPSVEADVSTDDWPFLYMPRRTYPRTYVTVILALLGASVIVIRQLVPRGRGRAGSRFSAPCFFLGAGFMLLETKSITELALVFGSTWLVVSAVITAILLMGFAANLVVARLQHPRATVVYALLLLSILGCWQLSRLDVAALGAAGGRVFLTIVLTLPLFFAGLAFSTELKTRAAVPAALSANLIGAMLGGFLEYNSMYLGFESLWLLGLAMYAAAAVAHWWERSRGAPARA